MWYGDIILYVSLAYITAFKDGQTCFHVLFMEISVKTQLVYIPKIYVRISIPNIYTGV